MPKPPDTYVIRLDNFRPDRTYLSGRPRAYHAAWLLVSWLFFSTYCPWPSCLKTRLLRLFGAKVGKGAVIKPNVYIHVPWNLRIGDHVWVGQGCVLLSFSTITLEPHSALAHEVYLAAASHDTRASDMPYVHAPIIVRSGAWVATRATVLAGVTISTGCVVQAGSVVTTDTRAWTVVGGVPARYLRERDLA